MNPTVFDDELEDGDEVRWNYRANPCEVNGKHLGSFARFVSPRGTAFFMGVEGEDVIIRRANPRQKKVAEVDELFINGTQVLGDSA